jgi:hypothetical protein
LSDFTWNENYLASLTTKEYKNKYMAKKTIIFEISGIAQTIGVEEAKKEG